jgi:hypothetical protein
MLNLGVAPTNAPHRLLVSADAFHSIVDSVALQGDYADHFSFSNIKTTVPSLGEVCIECSVPMKRNLPSISNGDHIYQGQIVSSCKVKDTEGRHLAKADIDFDFGIAPRILTDSSRNSILTADLTYLVAKSAEVFPMVNSKVSERLREGRNLVAQTPSNQFINSQFIEIINDATKRHLSQISDQLIPNGFKLPLPDFVKLNDGHVRLLADGQVEISGQFSFE